MKKFLPVLSAMILAAAAVPAAPRVDTRLDAYWRYHQGDVTGAEKINFADDEWTTVSLPHNWGFEEAQKGRKYYRGPGWYRRDLILRAQPGRRYFLRFEAAGSVADVYVNGQRLGQHRGAFGAFSFEITPHISPSGTNVIAVRASNAGENDVAPLSGDFCMFGGLYRPVHLVETDAINFTVTDHGSPGVAWRQTSVSEKEAVLDVVAQISNSTTQRQECILNALVLDGTAAIAGTEQKFFLPPKVTVPVMLRVTLTRPHLWNGLKDPFLHTAVVELRSKSGASLDRVEQPLGLRFYRVDPDKGFFLNGKPYHLHGVNRHQDRIGKGWAITEADTDQDMALLKDLGCTVVRCAHYQHSDYFYSCCDKAGLLVWAELPQVNEINASPQFAETSRNQLLDLIRQNINHPSIFAWSLFNELWPGRPDPHRELQDLKIIANGEDPTRPTIAATATEQLPQMNKIPDWLGWNIYPGWYAGWGPKEDFGRILDRGKSMSREGGLCISEYGAGANILHHELNPVSPKTDGQWHPEEWQAIVHETAWREMKARPYVWGTFVWVMFDFVSNSRHEGNMPGWNDKGLVTSDRRTKKDAYYFYRANWSPEPTVYIASRRFTQRTNAVTDVKIYSNAKKVDLRLNGRPLDKPLPPTNGVFVWKNVNLDRGENRLEASAQFPGGALTDTCVWTVGAGNSKKPGQ